MDGSLENIRKALDEAKQQHQVESDNTQQTQTQRNDFVDEIVPHTSGNKETMYSGK